MVDVLFRAVALGLYSRWNEEDAWNSLQWAFDDSYVLMGVISYLYGNSIQRRQSEPDNFPTPSSPPRSGLTLVCRSGRKAGGN